MRLSRLCPLLILSLFLSTQATIAANRTTGGRGAAATSPFLAPVRVAGQALSEAFDRLRAVVLASPLAEEHRLSPEEERRAYVALWADMETGGSRLP